MKVTDLITITELSRIMNKSRPTIYKYISDFEEERYYFVHRLYSSFFLTKMCVKIK